MRTTRRKWTVGRVREPTCQTAIPLGRVPWLTVGGAKGWVVIAGAESAAAEGGAEGAGAGGGVAIAAGRGPAGEDAEVHAPAEATMAMAQSAKGEPGVREGLMRGGECPIRRWDAQEVGVYLFFGFAGFFGAEAGGFL